MHNSQAKPIAFADEQLDADLWQILGSWDQVQPQTYRGTIRPPSRIIIEEVEREYAAPVDRDDTLSAGEICGSQSAFGPVKISLAQPIARPRTTIATIFIVAVGAGLFALVMSVPERQTPIKRQSNSDNLRFVAQTHEPTRPTYTARVEKPYLAGRLPLEILKTSSARPRERAAQRPVTAKGFGVEQLHAGDITIVSKASEIGFRARDPSPIDISNEIVTSDYSETIRVSTPIVENGNDTPLITFTSENEKARARRNSVDALRALRRQ
jgi:hypothetical protein